MSVLPAYSLAIVESPEYAAVRRARTNLLHAVAELHAAYPAEPMSCACTSPATDITRPGDTTVRRSLGHAFDLRVVFGDVGATAVRCAGRSTNRDDVTE